MSNVAKMSDYQTKEVVIDGITVRQDSEGRYCLNDVHKASGGEVAKAPAQWMRHDVFHELLEEIVLKSTINPVEAKRGRTGGTYAVKSLVYAYAMWISPAYHLKVIEAYDRMVTDGVAVHESSAQDLLDNPLKYISALMTQAQTLVEENARLEQEVQKSASKAAVFDRFIGADGLYKFQEFCTALNLNQRTIKLWLRDIGWLRANRWERNPLPTAKAVDNGYCYIQEEESIFGFSEAIRFTKKAKAYVELKAPDYIRKKVKGSRSKAA
ncbi:KilA-N domain-containing protein [Pseudomonas putida]|uniref:KilA-N domain-containing protein n=1 Tax=Pseudomonas putida TaxID=303 RepID=UPI003D988A8A